MGLVTLRLLSTCLHFASLDSIMASRLMTGENAVLVLLLSLVCFSGLSILGLRKFHWRWQVAGVNFLVFILLVSIFSIFGELYYRFFYDSSESLSITKVGKE